MNSLETGKEYFLYQMAFPLHDAHCMLKDEFMHYKSINADSNQKFCLHRKKKSAACNRTFSKRYWNVMNHNHFLIKWSFFNLILKKSYEYNSVILSYQCLPTGCQNWDYLFSRILEPKKKKIISEVMQKDYNLQLALMQNHFPVRCEIKK